MDSLTLKASQFQKPDGSYTVPTGDEFTKPGSGFLMNLAKGETFPSFETERGLQRTFLIPAAYPDNTTAYSINTQFGWTHQSNYLESHGTAWRGFGLTTTVQSQMDEAGYEDVIPDCNPPPPNQVSAKTPHPMNRLYLNSEPAYGAPSWLETQFLINYGVTDGIWPYHVLPYFNPNTTGPHGYDHHPIIRKGIGQRLVLT